MTIDDGSILGDYLVMHLSELVRLAFIAATATSDQLKLEGLKTLQVCECSVNLYHSVGMFSVSQW